MKNILFVMPDLMFGGVENSLINLLNNVDENVKCTVLMYGKDYSLLSRLKNKNVNIKIIKTSKIAELAVNFMGNTIKKYGSILNDYYLRKYKTIRYIRKHNKEYNYIINYHAKTLLKTMKKANVENEKMIMWFHGPDYLEKVFCDENIGIYNNIVVVSEIVRSNILTQKKCLENKVRVINNIIPYKEIAEKSEEKPILPKTDFNIVTVGRIDDEKGVDTAIEALTILKGKISNVKWYWVGDFGNGCNDYKSDVHNMIRKNHLENDFILTGAKDNPYPYMKQCDLYVQPSHMESFGLTMAEAQICGATIVATDTAGARTLIENGKNGVITDNNCAALADGIYDMYSDFEKRERIALNAKNIDFEKNNRKIINDFYDLLGMREKNERK